jgi:hypothetical protein
MFGASNIPVPDIDTSRFLFKIERSRNADEVIYELNLDANNRINGKEPIKVYWLKKTDHNKIESLTNIQQNYSYGIKYLNQTNHLANEWHFHLIAYPKKTFVLKILKDNSFKVITTDGNREIIVEHLYIHFKNTNFWDTSISSVEIFGIELLSGKQVAETLEF